MRQFLEVDEKFRKFPDVHTLIPKRSTLQSAGYDFFSKENAVIEPGQSHLFWTDIRAIMEPTNVLLIYTRSGNGCKRGIVLRNGTGIIDADYSNNPENQIGIMLYNTGNQPFEVKVGDRIAQGIFMNYLTTDNETLMMGGLVSRTGGFGSSGR